MDEKIEMLHDLCHTLTRELEQYTDKASRGKISATDLDTIDKLTHSLKSLKTIIAMEESGYSGSYGHPVYAYDGGNSYRGRSYRRDSMGRYAREGHGDSDIAENLRSVMDRISDPQARQELQYLLGRMGN